MLTYLMYMNRIFKFLVGSSTAGIMVVYFIKLIVNINWLYLYVIVFKLGVLRELLVSCVVVMLISHIQVFED
jgi:hypothetical protein